MADFAKVQEQIKQDEEVVDVPIFQKNGQPYLGADGSQSTIGVLGAESRKAQVARDSLTQRMIRSRAGKMTPKDLRQNRIDQAAAVVVRWSGWEHEGKPWPCEPENVKAVLSADHILEQVEEGIARHADFFGNSSSS